MPPALRPPTNPPPTTPAIFAFSIFSILCFGLVFLRFASRRRFEPERQPLLRGRTRTSRRVSNRNGIPQRTRFKLPEPESTVGDVAVAVTDSRESSPNKSSEEVAQANVPALSEVVSEVVKPKNVILVVERRDSDSSIASASTIDSDGPTTPDEEVSCLRLGNGKGGVDTPALEIGSEEVLGNPIPVQSAAIMV